jgi:hypothetical protein
MPRVLVLDGVEREWNATNSFMLGETKQSEPKK